MGRKKITGLFFYNKKEPHERFFQNILI